MTSEAAEPAEFEPSPFDEDAEAVEPRRPWEPAKPLTQGELDSYMTRPLELRLFNPWRCMFNLVADDGIGYYSGRGRVQCDVLLADPTKSRYCLEHARKMGVFYYAPPELAEAVAKETASNLTRLVPKATKTLELAMDDEDSPMGVRAKAAAEVLDRTGYVRGVDVRVDAQIATVDVTAVLKDRLDALKESMVIPESGAAITVVGETIDPDERDHDPEPDPDPGTAGAGAGGAA